MIPIHDQGYRRYGGKRAPHGRAWWIIARTHMFAALKFRSFVILLLASWLPFVARGVQIYLSSSFQQVSMLAASAQTFRDFLDQQGLFVFLVTIALGGAIADDRRANALQLYLSKPLTRCSAFAPRRPCLCWSRHSSSRFSSRRPSGSSNARCVPWRSLRERDCDRAPLEVVRPGLRPE